MTDALTKLVNLEILYDKTATSVGGALLNWCTTYGVPEEVVTDQGKEFCNSSIKDLWDRLKVKHQTTTPYHPRSNGQAERFNRSMCEYLDKMMDKEKAKLGEWISFIPTLQLGYNTSIHRATRTSPFEAMFGYTPNVVHFPNLYKIFDIRDNPGLTEQQAQAQLRNDREDIRTNVKDLLFFAAKANAATARQGGQAPKGLETGDRGKGLGEEARCQRA